MSNYFKTLQEKISKVRSKYYYQRQFTKSISQLRKLNMTPVSEDRKEIRLFAVLRNESLRLPHFLKYYENLGVDRFFFVDNNSTDNSKDIILKNSNSHLYFTQDSYQNHWFWIEYLLEQYGKGHWCIVVDIDELFTFPYAEFLSIKELIRFLEHEKSESVRAYLLDMYSKNSLSDSRYEPGENPLLTVSYFDKEYTSGIFSFQDRKRFEFFNSVIFTGGVRERVFGQMSPPHILSKIPLFHYTENTYLAQGMHAINRSRISEIQSAVFHTKFLDDFPSEVLEEVQREEHYGNAIYYKHYQYTLKKKENISFHNHNSIKYIDSGQLVQLGIMKSSILFNKFIDGIKS